MMNNESEARQCDPLNLVHSLKQLVHVRGAARTRPKNVWSQKNRRESSAHLCISQRPYAHFGSPSLLAAPAPVSYVNRAGLVSWLRYRSGNH